MLPQKYQRNSQLRLNLLNNAHNLDIKVTMANFSDIFVVTSGTLVTSTILSATMICTVTRLNQSTVMNRLNSMAENPYVINGHDVVVTTAVVNTVFRMKEKVDVLPVRIFGKKRGISNVTSFIDLILSIRSFT